MKTITLDIEHITGSLREPFAAHVHCTMVPYFRDLDAARYFTVVISRNSVTVRELAGPDSPVTREPGDVLVSNTLVDATRRLFGLVGEV